MYKNIPAVQSDPILGLQKLFKESKHPQKVNLGVGVYKDAHLNNTVLKAVVAAEKELIQNIGPKNYAPIEGTVEFNNSVQSFFTKLIPFKPDNLFTMQALGGTGALRLGAETLKNMKVPCISIPNPSWANHKAVFEEVGLKVDQYPYFDKETGTSFDAALAHMEKLPAQSAVLIHLCCHNPTGYDFTEEHIDAISDLCIKKELFPFFDCAYHGFKNDLETDLYGLKPFLKKAIPFYLAYSFSKNMGLYGERVGTLAVHHPDSRILGKLGPWLIRTARRNYSNPPIHGGLIASTVLGSDSLYLQWTNELKEMKERVHHVRHQLKVALADRTKRDFDFICEQSGLFSFIGLSSSQVDYLRAEKGLYMPQSGRINVAGISEKNLSYVVDSLAQAFNKA